jgi:hypothetical protein
MPIDMEVDPKLRPQLDTSPPTTRAPLVGIIALAATFGAELMLTAFIAWGRIWQRPQRALFTTRAWSMLYPERDLQIYVAGIGLTLLIVLVACGMWTRLNKKTTADPSANRTVSIQVALAVAGLIGFLFLLSSRLPLDRLDHRPTVSVATGLQMSLVGIAAFVIAAIDWQFRISSRLPRLLALAGPILVALSIRFQLLLAPAAMELELLVLLAMLFYWLRVRRNQDPELWKRHVLRRSAILAAMACGTFAIYLTLLPATDPTQTGSLFDDPLGFRARIPVFAMVLCLVLDLHWGSILISTKSKARFQRLIDVALPLLLAVTLFISPSRWMILTGTFLQNDALHHWNYFTLGPALAFAHGRALVTQT